MAESEKSEAKESVVSIRTDAAFRKDLEQAMKVTGIRSQADVVRYAVRLVASRSEGK